MKQRAIFSVLFVIIPVIILAQKVQHDPFFTVSTHPITVVSAAAYSDSLVLVLSVENKSDEGYFCVNRKVFIEDLVTGIRTYMSKESGLPHCPDVYHFKWKGEQKTFFLTFPVLDKKTRYVNVVEDCKDHCFTLYGLVLDENMNRYINAAYDAYRVNKTADALGMFERIVKLYPDYPFGVFYENIIEILIQEGKFDEAGKWYQKLQYSNFLDKKALLNKVRSIEGFNKIVQNK
ncbi:MAG: tetratricopeptide repeat protein [Bacteroidales bacterium]|nr:tetratricopeptide repeat protein [Bacteroidales bacterium]